MELNEKDQGIKIEKMSDPGDVSGQVVMRLKAYMEALSGSLRSGEVDKDTLIELVTLAKGNRSMRKFAEDMGVNVSSVSRILNGKVTEISDELLVKIAAAADPESGVTIEKLMEAQGIVRRESISALANKYEDDCRRIMSDELLKRGYSVSYPKMGLTTWRGNTAYDFEIITDAIPKGGGRWLVEVKMMTQYSRFPQGTGRTQIWLDSAMAHFYRGDDAGRISLIVDHRAVFDQLKERLSHYQLKDEISILLISTKAGRIMDEYVAPLSNGETPILVFGTTEQGGQFIDSNDHAD